MFLDMADPYQSKTLNGDDQYEKYKSPADQDRV